MMPVLTYNSNVTVHKQDVFTAKKKITQSHVAIHSHEDLGAIEYCCAYSQLTLACDDTTVICMYLKSLKHLVPVHIQL